MRLDKPLAPAPSEPTGKRDSCSTTAYRDDHKHNNSNTKHAHHETTHADNSPLHSLNPLAKQDHNIASHSLNISPDPTHRRPTSPSLPTPRIPSNLQQQLPHQRRWPNSPSKDLCSHFFYLIWPIHEDYTDSLPLHLHFDNFLVHFPEISYY